MGNTPELKVSRPADVVVMMNRLPSVDIQLLFEQLGGGGRGVWGGWCMVRRYVQVVVLRLMT